MKRRPGMEADFYFDAGPYSWEEIKVIRFEGEEALSEPFHFRLDVAMEESEPDFEAMLGKPGLISIEGTEGTRYVSGIIRKFEQAGEPTRLTQYKAELVPKIWLLGLRQKSRIFQEMNVPDIIKKVLTDAKIPSNEFKFQLTRKYPDREYCVQYRESDLDFISRILAEEGIFYYFHGRFFCINQKRGEHDSQVFTGAFLFPAARIHHFQTAGFGKRDGVRLYFPHDAFFLAHSEKTRTDICREHPGFSSLGLVFSEGVSEGPDNQLFPTERRSAAKRL